MKKAPLAVSVILFSLLCHILVFILISLSSNGFPVQADHLFRSGFLLSFSIALSVVIFFIQKRLAFRLFILLRFIIVIVIISTFRSVVGIELSLIASIIIEISIYERFPKNLILSAVLVLIDLLLYVTIFHKAVEISHAFISNLTIVGVSLLTLACVSSLLIFYREKFIDQTTFADRLNAVIRQLTKAKVGLQQYADDIEKQSKVEERNRISREIHDTIGYTLTNLVMMIEAATDFSSQDPNKTRELLKMGKEEALDGLKEMRRILHLIRKSKEDRIPLFLAIHNLARTLQDATGISVNTRLENLPRTLGDETDAAVYRTVQEGMTNALRHGKATEIDIYFWKENSTARIMVRDNGQGTNEIKKGIGLSGMEERFKELGGEVVAHNVKDGFEISVSIPIKLKE